MKKILVLSKPKVLKLYHGTTKGAAELILAKGLKAVKDKNYDSGYYDEGRGKYVYLVDTLAEALSWAAVGYWERLQKSRHTNQKFRKNLRLAAKATYAVVEVEVKASDVVRDDRVPLSDGTVMTKPLAKKAIKKVTYFTWPELDTALRKAGYKPTRYSTFPHREISAMFKELNTKTSTPKR